MAPGSNSQTQSSHEAKAAGCEPLGHLAALVVCGANHPVVIDNIRFHLRRDVYVMC